MHKRLKNVRNKEVLYDDYNSMIVVGLSVNPMRYYRCRSGTLASPLPCGRCFTCSAVWGLFPSFRFTPSGQGLLHGQRHGAGQQQLARALLPHGRRLWGGEWVCVFLGACFLPSFLHSSCWMARWFVGAIPQPTVGHPVQPGLNARRDPVPLRGASVFFGGWGFFRSPLGWVWTRGDVF